MTANVLQLIGSLDEGGSERQALQLTTLLAARGRRSVHVACLDGRGCLREEVPRLGLGPVPEFRFHRFYSAGAARQIGRFARFLRRHRIAIVHTHDFYTNVFGMVGAALARVPVRVASRRETTGCRTPAQAIVERAVFGLAHAVLANSQAVVDRLLEEGVPARKIATIYNGLDPQRVTPPPDFSRDRALACFQLPASADSRFVTIVANLRLPVKDHPTFLRAAARVRQAVGTASFIIAGEGPLAGPMKDLAATLGLDRDVHFVGRCHHLPELLALSDVCVLSSSAEGFSNAILEYMAAGRPVVATDVGGAREAVADGVSGYLVPARDDAAMAERIVRLLRDPAAARTMGERGRAVVMERFSCAAQLARVEQLYEGLLRGRRAHEVGVQGSGLRA